MFWIVSERQAPIFLSHFIAEISALNSKFEKLVTFVLLLQGGLKGLEEVWL